MPLHAPPDPDRCATWEVFCRVIDNHGDAGVCWRLATDLASRGVAVRLWVDDARALTWMAPEGCTGVEVRPWPTNDDDTANARADAAEVVIEAFGCGLPEPTLRQMADAHQRSAAPVWINLEHLSAEPYVERCHGLPSPQHSGAGRGLTSWFFYPGFTPRTGGLLRGTGLMRWQAAFDRNAWLAQHGIAPQAGERVVSLFCYANPRLPDLLRTLAEHPTLLLTTPGHATEQVAQAMSAVNGRCLRTQPLPWLAQPDYDALLRACDLNVVRGEDSLVRAIWAGRAFVWQTYPQHDGAHAAKLAALLVHALKATEPALADAIRRAALQWNGLSASAAPSAWSLLNSPASMAAWGSGCAAWRDELLTQPDLCTQLMAFAAAKQAGQQARI